MLHSAALSAPAAVPFAASLLRGSMRLNGSPDGGLAVRAGK